MLFDGLKDRQDIPLQFDNDFTIIVDHNMTQFVWSI